MNEIYEQFRAACAAHGTTITKVLNAIGHSDGSTGAWKSGKYLRLDTVIAIAEELGISLDELCFGPANKALSLRTMIGNGSVPLTVFPGIVSRCVKIFSGHI